MILITLVLFLAGALAGFVDSIAGGGGMITVPALLAVGLPPHLALGTNKLQSCFGSFTSTFRYTQKKLVDLKTGSYGVLFTAIGAFLGTKLVSQMDSELLMQLIPFLLIVLFLYVLFSPKLGASDRHHLLPTFLFYLIFGLLIGFYDGFLGPGTGSFWTLALVGILGLNLKKATGQTKLMNFTSNIVSLVAFLMYGQVHLVYGLAMGAGQICGAYCGSHMVIHKSTKFIRVFFLAVVACTIIYLLVKNYT